MSAPRLTLSYEQYDDLIAHRLTDRLCAQRELKEEVRVWCEANLCHPVSAGACPRRMTFGITFGSEADAFYFKMAWF